MEQFRVLALTGSYYMNESIDTVCLLPAEDQKEYADWLKGKAVMGSVQHESIKISVKDSPTAQAIQKNGNKGQRELYYGHGESALYIITPEQESEILKMAYELGEALFEVGALPPEEWETLQKISSGEESLDLAIAKFRKHTRVVHEIFDKSLSKLNKTLDELAKSKHNRPKNLKSIKDASGVSGVLHRAIDGDYSFRIYHSDGTFTDYALFHNELPITIEKDSFSSFYEFENKNVLAHSIDILRSVINNLKQ